MGKPSVGCLANIAEQLRRQDEEAFLVSHTITDYFGVFIRQNNIGRKSFIADLMLAFVDIFSDIFRKEPLEQEVQDVGLEISAIHRTARLVDETPISPYVAPCTTTPYAPALFLVLSQYDSFFITVPDGGSCVSMC